MYSSSAETDETSCSGSGDTTQGPFTSKSTREFVLVIQTYEIELMIKSHQQLAICSEKTILGKSHRRKINIRYFNRSPACQGAEEEYLSSPEALQDLDRYRQILLQLCWNFNLKSHILSVALLQ